MSEMVTRVAKALAEESGVIWGSPHGEDDPDFALPRAMYFALARAAIGAMREPTEPMIEAFKFHGMLDGDFDEALNAMIDAALE